jgi:hypothetical protein
MAATHHYLYFGEASGIMLTRGGICLFFVIVKVSDHAE